MNISLKKSLQALLLVPVMALGVASFVPATPAGALGIQGGADAAKSDEQSDNLFEDGGLFQTITNVLLFLIGAVAVIMLIIGGIRYTVSGGDSTAITAAKNTILYAIIGIIVAIISYAVVNWVIGSFVA